MYVISVAPSQNTSTPDDTHRKQHDVSTRF